MMRELTFACGGYDRVQPLRDGSVSVEGVELNMLRLEPEECFWRMMQGAEFDVAEMSLSSYCIAKAKGDDRFVGIPAFLSRSFRHSSIYLSPSTAIADPKELAGRRIGVPEYQMTASVWTRGMLANDCGADLSDVTWVTGGLEQPGRVERQKLELPDHIRVESVGAQKTLAAALEEGEIDALMAPRVPRVFRRAGSGIRRLFPDYAIREKDYFERTGLFPIMHMVVVRKDVLQDHPWVAASLYKALREAKEVATAGLSDLPALRYTMPFLLAALEEQEAVFGPDPWPYGMEANRTALETFISYLHEQGLISTALAPESLFAPSTLREFRI